jgi:hypothetical protein
LIKTVTYLSNSKANFIQLRSLNMSKPQAVIDFESAREDKSDEIVNALSACWRGYVGNEFCVGMFSHGYDLGSTEAPHVRKLVEALEFIVKGEPTNGDSGACTFCDMGGAGYSSKGDRHHDDVRDFCPVVKAEAALREYQSVKESLGK